MADSRRLVERVIESDPVIKRGLQRGIINSRALARFMRETDGIDTSPEAILGIIRRYPVEREEVRAAREILRDADLALRGKVEVLTLENSAHVIERILEFVKSIKIGRGENLRVNLGVKSAEVTADQRVLDQFREGFREKEVIGYARNLTEISILLPAAAYQITGIVGRIATELELNGVNPFSIICSNPQELILDIDNKSAPKALEVLERMISESTPFTGEYSSPGSDLTTKSSQATHLQVNYSSFRPPSQ